jgi:hypothetical protein
VGAPTYKAIIGNKLSPSYADHVLARTGYDGQQTSEAVSPDRKDNVWRPVDEDRGIHGDFTRQSTNRSLTLWAATHRGLVAVAGGVMVLGALVAAGRKKA